MDLKTYHTQEDRIAELEAQVVELQRLVKQGEKWRKKFEAVKPPRKTWTATKYPAPRVKP